jgi:hypothetical protein
MDIHGLSILETIALVDGLTAKEAVQFSKKFHVSVRPMFLDIISSVYIDTDDAKIIQIAWEQAVDVRDDWLN